MGTTYIFKLETESEVSSLMFSAAYRGHAATLCQTGAGAYELSIALVDEGREPIRELRSIVGETKLPVYGPLDEDDDDRISAYRVIGDRVQWSYGDEDKLEGEVL